MERGDDELAIVFDNLAMRHGGMLATNGHSLYKSRDVIMDCLAQILDNSTQSTITIADVGTADGSTSLALMNEIIGLRKALGDKVRVSSETSRQIMIYYTDLLNNDFNRLFSVINDQDGLRLGSNVFSAAIGRTMFEQCLPDNSSDLIISSIAAWALSKSPCQVRDGLLPTEENPMEMEAYRSQAAIDWKTFLVMRGRELRKGGYLVVLNIGTTKQGETTMTIKGEWNTLSEVFRSLVTDDLVTTDEFLNCNRATAQYRTEEDHAFPFTENDLIETGLELISTRSFVNKLDHPSFHISNKDDATKKVYADRIVAGIKPWLYGTIYKGLSPSRSKQERESLVEMYFSRLWDFAYKNDDYGQQLALVEVVARRRV